LFTFIKRQKEKFLFSIISRAMVLVLSLSLVFAPTAGYAQSLSLLNLPAPGTMISISPGYTPLIIRGLTVHPDNPLKFNFIVDTGNTDLGIESAEFKESSERLVKYFLASLTVPEKELWVNLSPYEMDRIIPEGLGQTEMGRDLLAQDYLLKQLTASLMYPEQELGEKFWKRVYQKALDKYGTTEIPINTFNKVWIVPDKGVVYEHDGTAFVIEQHLKVMLEEDYLALQKNMNDDQFGMDQLNVSQVEAISGVSSEVVREILIPEIEKEVNQGKNFANLRQIYNSMILAVWYKRNLKESLLGQIYFDKNKTKGVDVADKGVTHKIYEQYLQAFNQGVYNYIKEDYDLASKEVIPRKYFSGGMKMQTAFADQYYTEIEKGSSPISLEARQKAANLRIGVYGDVEVDLLENAANDKHYERAKIVGEIPSLVQHIPENELTNDLLEAHRDRKTKREPTTATNFKRVGIVYLSMALGFLSVDHFLNAGEFTRDQIDRLTGLIALTITGLRDDATSIAPSHVGHPGFENLKFTYDAAIDALVLMSKGDQEGAERILDYFAEKLNISLEEVRRLADSNHIYGIIKLMESSEGIYDIKGLINAFDRTSTKPQGQGQLEYYSTPGPISFMGLAFLHVNRHKFRGSFIIYAEIGWRPYRWRSRAA